MVQGFPQITPNLLGAAASQTGNSGGKAQGGKAHLLLTGDDVNLDRFE